MIRWVSWRFSDSTGTSGFFKLKHHVVMQLMEHSQKCPETRVSCFLMHVRKPCIYIFSKLIWKVSRERPSLTKRKYGKVAHKSITPMSRRAAPNCFPPSLTTAKVPREETLVKNKMYVKFLIGKNGNECPVCDPLLNDTGMCLQQNLMNV